jgi:hypothetical protein
MSENKLEFTVNKQITITAADATEALAKTGDVGEGLLIGLNVQLRPMAPQLPPQLVPGALAKFQQQQKEKPNG